MIKKEGEDMLKMDLNIDDIIELDDGRIFITNNGNYPTHVFMDRYSGRYGEEGITKAREYGKSLIGDTFDLYDRKFEIIGYDLMMGSMDYVGSLLFHVKEIN